MSCAVQQMHLEPRVINPTLIFSSWSCRGLCWLQGREEVEAEPFQESRWIPSQQQRGRSLSPEGMVLLREEILWTDLSWNEISSKIWVRKPQNPVGQKCFAGNELSALGGEPEPDTSQIILQLELPLAATCWSDGMCAPSPEWLNADRAGTYVKIIF